MTGTRAGGIYVYVLCRGDYNNYLFLLEDIWRNDQQKTKIKISFQKKYKVHFMPLH